MAEKSFLAFAPLGCHINFTVQSIPGPGQASSGQVKLVQIRPDYIGLGQVRLGNIGCIQLGQVKLD